jgi:hypothetical protein
MEQRLSNWSSNDIRMAKSLGTCIVWDLETKFRSELLRSPGTTDRKIGTRSYSFVYSLSLSLFTYFFALWRCMERGSSELSDPQIAGGTGVTPAYQCINDSQQARPSASSPTLSLVYASASPSSIFLRPQLDQFNKTGTLSKVRYHVDRSDQPTLPENTRLGLMDGKSLEEFVGRKDPTTRRVIVICGPEG